MDELNSENRLKIRKLNKMETKKPQHQVNEAAEQAAALKNAKRIMQQQL